MRRSKPSPLHFTGSLHLRAKSSERLRTQGTSRPHAETPGHRGCRSGVPDTGRKPDSRHRELLQGHVEALEGRDKMGRRPHLPPGTLGGRRTREALRKSLFPATACGEERAVHGGGESREEGADLRREVRAWGQVAGPGTQGPTMPGACGERACAPRGAIQAPIPALASY